MKKSCRVLLSALGLSLLSAIPAVAESIDAIGGIMPMQPPPLSDSFIKVACAVKIKGIDAATANKMILPCPATVLYQPIQTVCVGTNTTDCPVFTNGPTPLDPVTEGRYLSKTCSIKPTKVGGACDYALPIYSNELLSAAYTDKIKVTLPVKGLACSYASEPIVNVAHSAMQSPDTTMVKVGSVMVVHNLVCSKVVPNKK